MRFSVKPYWGLLTAVLIGLSSLLAACGGGGAGGSSSTGGGTPAASPPSIAKLSIGTSTASVKSDNSDTATLTVSALDSNNALVKGAAINLSASSGQISSAKVTTDATTGLATVTFSAGFVDLFNRTATITATVSGSTVTGALPIKITGSTLTSSATSLSPNTGVPVTLAATTKISNGSAAAPNQALRISIAASSTGSGTLSSTSATTDNSGNANLTFTGTAAGVVNLLIEWLDSNNNTTISTTQTLNVQAAGAAFQVATPSSSPWSVTLGNLQSLIVDTPATINGTAVANIRYATTLGSWQANGLKTLTVPRTAASDTQIFLAGAFAGNANIQIDALSSTGAVLATAKIIFALSASAASANSITLQSNVSVLAPSAGGTKSTAILTASVRDISNNTVGGASVLFELVNPTGTGEQIDPVVVSTNSSGVAQSTFTAGTSTLQTSQIRASVIGSAVTPSTINITVGGTAGSVAIGTSSKITSINSDTSYQLPVTVFVTDSNGNAVSGATVSLSLWPQSYHKGTRNTSCAAIWTYSHVNEDINENLILDPGEDIDGPGNPLGLGLPDGALWPPSPAAGSVPQTVTTGSDGTATFNWIYLKQYADWITARLRASVIVLGSEATTTTSITLGHSTADESPCSLPSSPFN